MIIMYILILHYCVCIILIIFIFFLLAKYFIFILINIFFYLLFLFPNYTRTVYIILYISSITLIRTISIKNEKINFHTRIHNFV